MNTGLTLSTETDACEAVDLFCVLAGRWTLHVLYQLHTARGPLRFTELKMKVGKITQKELTKTLRLLESLGLVLRTQFAEIPPRVEYRVTELGASLEKPIIGLGAWLSEHPELRATFRQLGHKAD
jgi:DNA-binding HxlR family transcriptional regulator